MRWESVLRIGNVSESVEGIPGVGLLQGLRNAASKQLHELGSKEKLHKECWTRGMTQALH